ncbi:MAG: carbohydrate kinase family protein [Spirochaetota bacterium]
MIICVGEALIDFIPQDNGSGRTCFLPSPGGSPYNTAICLGRLDAAVGFLGKLSTDFFGDMLIDRLTENGVDVSGVVRSNQPTTLAFVTRDERGDARYAFFAENSAERSMLPEDVPAELPGDDGALLFGSISTLMEPGATTITKLVEREDTRRVVSFDPNVRSNLIPSRSAYVRKFEHLVAHTTIVKISDDDLAWIYPEASPEDAAGHLLDLGTRLVVLTQGAEGSTAITRSAGATAPAARTTVSDTIGAGDSFHGGFLAWLHNHDRLSIDAVAGLTEQELRDALTYAAAVSGITCSRAGADPPTAGEVAEHLRRG